jgi:hypothetical protein
MFEARVTVQRVPKCKIRFEIRKANPATEASVTEGVPRQDWSAAAM